jgi:hypothetical protein
MENIELLILYLIQKIIVLILLISAIMLVSSIFYLAGIWFSYLLKL